MRSTRLPSWIERLAGLDDPRGPASVFLLDERELVFAHFLRRDAASPELAAVRRRELPAATFQEGALGGPLREPAEFHAVVAELAEAAATAVGASVAAAALVLPDRWLRLTFADLEQAPKNPEQREAALRFKLRKQVPFRVEELRVRSAPAGEGEEGATRFLIGFGVDHVLNQIEESFRRSGIRIGTVTNASLGAANGLRHVHPGGGSYLLLLAHHDGYSLLAHGPAGPALFRYKTIDPALPDDVADRLAVRELKLSRSFIEHRRLFSGNGGPPDQTLMLAPEGAREAWRRRLEDGLGLPAHILDDEAALGSAVEPGAIHLAQALPMLGASLTVRT